MPDENFGINNDIYERIEADSRVRVVEESAMDVTTQAGLAKARDTVNLAIHEGMVTAGELARRTGEPASQVSAFRSDKWKGSPGTLATLAGKLAKAVDALILQKKADETQISGFVLTRFARKVYAITQYAIKRRSMVGFVAPAGSGKSVTLAQLAADTPGANLVTITRARNTAKGFLQLWARQLGLDEQGHCRDIQDAIVSRVIRSDRLLLVDEASKLTVPALDSLREVWDQANFPCVLAGTPSFYRTLTTRRVGVASSELMDQLYSRVRQFYDLTELASDQSGDPERLFTVDDIRKLFARGRVRLTHDGAEFLCRLANMPGAGGVRVCKDLVQLVVDMYPEEPVTAARVQGALVVRAGTRDAFYRTSLAAADDPEPASMAATA